jgi:hypothetical protein
VKCPKCGVGMLEISDLEANYILYYECILCRIKMDPEKNEYIYPS